MKQRQTNATIIGFGNLIKLKKVFKRQEGRTKRTRAKARREDMVVLNLIKGQPQLELNGRKNSYNQPDLRFKALLL